MNNYEKIEALVEQNNGFLRVKDLDENKIHRQYLKIMEEKGLLVKLIKGLYVKPDKDVNEFFITGERFKSGIFSHNTALYFYHLTDRTPYNLDMTFPSTVRVTDYSVVSHYMKPENFLLGATTMELEDGTSIRIYDLERTICDIIRDRNKLDPQVFNTAMKEYFKLPKKNLNLLYKYAKKLSIDKILKQYIEVLN